MTAAPSIRRCRRKAQRGFTLIEITVALVAGLVVGLAVVALSKEATSTFHEETRTSAAEMTLRTAIDRLRADVARAGYMSTPSIAGDPTLAVGYSVPTGVTVAQIGKLSGIRVYRGASSLKANFAGATTGGPAAVSPSISGTDDDGTAFSANNNLSPDAVDISGNLTSADVFVAGIGPGAVNANCAGGSQLNFQMDMPAIQAIINGTSPATALRDIFLPAGMTTGVARVINDSGRPQYVLVCATAVAGSAPNMTATVDVGPLAGLSGFATGRIRINPVATVRWRLAATSNYASFATLTSPADTIAGGASARFDLYRGYLDATGAEVGTPELVAEYAVDLKLAWTWDSSADGVTPVTNRYPFDSVAAFTSWNKIRSVGIRLAVRGAIADRKVNLAVPAAPTSYLFRYCTLPTGPGTCGPNYARVRTTMTEVALQNHARSWWATP